MKLKSFYILAAFIGIANINLSAQTNQQLYPAFTNREVSRGKTCYYINPKSGDDQNKGTNRQKPWKTFRRVNHLILTAGDKLEILSPGTFHETLSLIAKGNRKQPVKIKFAAGTYNFFPDQALKIPLHISNTNNSPYKQKAIAIMLDSCTHTDITGYHAIIVLRGKMIETYITNSTKIKLDGLSFDYYRPTVSELKVINVSSNYADLKIHKDSRFAIKDSILTWIGEGWSYQPGNYWQMLNIKTNYVHRVEFTLNQLSFVHKGGNNVRAYFKYNPGFKENCVYQNRETERDCAGIFIQKSKNVTLRNIRIYFMHGMGIVSQYCENINIKKLVVKPRESTGRTCAAWADILHFSGCKGFINVENSYLSAANDDAINVHGTYLKIVKIEGPNKIRVRFMHPETYGFNPFSAGDSIEYINPENLLSKGANLVSASAMLNDREILLTTNLPITSNGNDFVENITATPQVSIHNNTIARIPTRGVLITTRRKTSIFSNNFQRTFMSAILVSDDVNHWFESGMVKDLSIKGNNFDRCGEPVIKIYPENTKTDESVHSNIRVFNNTFHLIRSRLLVAKSTSNLKIIGNIIKTPLSYLKIHNLIELQSSTATKIKNNKIIKF